MDHSTCHQLLGEMVNMILLSLYFSFVSAKTKICMFLFFCQNIFVKNMELHKWKPHCQNVSIFLEIFDKSIHFYLQGMISSSRVLCILIFEKHFHKILDFFYFIFMFQKGASYLLGETVRRLCGFSFYTPFSSLLGFFCGSRSKGHPASFPIHSYPRCSLLNFSSFHIMFYNFHQSSFPLPLFLTILA